MAPLPRSEKQPARLTDDLNRYDMLFDILPTNGDDTARQQDCVAPDNDSNPTLSPICKRCNQRFKANKSLLRHLRTVHQPKAFFCFRCNTEFVRKDTRDRYVAEMHATRDRTVRCTSCRRYISERAFSEYFNTAICHSVRYDEASTAVMDLNLCYTGADDDPFLATLRLFKFFERKDRALFESC